MARYKGGLGVSALVALKSDHSGLVTVGTDFQPTSTAATTASHLAMILNQKASTGIQPANSGKGKTIEIDTDQFSIELQKMIDSFRTTGDDSSSETEHYENGVVKPTPDGEVSVSGDSGNMAVGIHYVRTKPGDATKVLVLVAVNQFSEDSGAFSTSYDEVTTTSCQLITKPAKADISIPAALFDSTIVTVSAAQEIPEGKEFVWLELTKA